MADRLPPRPTSVEAVDSLVTDAFVLDGIDPEFISGLLAQRLGDQVMRATRDRVTTRRGTTYHFLREGRWERFIQGSPAEMIVGAPLWVDNAERLNERFSDLYGMEWFDVQTVTATAS